MTRKILLIPKGFLGDILLTSPVLSALKKNSSGVSISVLCSPATAEIVRRDLLVDGVLVFDRRVSHRGWRGLREFAETIKEEGFDAAYSFQMSPRTAILLWMTGIKRRVSFEGSFSRFFYTNLVPRVARYHDVIRNLTLVREELDHATRADVEELAKDIGLDVPWSGLRIPEIDEEELSDSVKQILAGKTPRVVLSPGSAWETKRWDAQGFRGVAQSLRMKGLDVVIVGAPADAEVCAEVVQGLDVSNLCGKTSLNELTALIRGSACLVCNDSLALHIGSAVQTPTVAIFCATSPRFGFGPWRNRAVVLEKSDLFCKPCRRHGSRGCPTGTRACMTGVSSSEVVCAVERFLGESGRGSSSGGLRVVKH